MRLWHRLVTPTIMRGWSKASPSAPKMQDLGSALLIVMSVAGFIAFAYAADTRQLTELEAVLLQFFIATAGYIGTFMAGRRSVRRAAKDVIKPHARSAFRRLVSLYRSHQWMASVIEESRDSRTIEEYRLTLAKLEGIAIGQINTADAAMDDWRDIVPEDVEELHNSARRVSRGEQ